MKTLSEVVSVLLEGLEEADRPAKKKPEAPQDAALGQFAFASQRKDVPDEPDNDLERKLIYVIKHYIENNNKVGLNPYGKTLYDLAKAGYYKKILDPSKFQYAYRILQVEKEKFASIIGVDPTQLNKFGSSGPGTLVPHGGEISGWTVKLSTFTKEEFEGYGRGNTFAIFRAPIAGNQFFGNPGEFVKGVGMGNFSDEWETIALGPVHFDKVMFFVLTPDELYDGETSKRVIKRMASFLK